MEFINTLEIIIIKKIILIEFINNLLHFGKYF